MMWRVYSSKTKKARKILVRPEVAELIRDTPKLAFDHYGREWGQHYQNPLWAAGNPAGWNDFFESDLIPSAMALVLEAWGRMAGLPRTNGKTSPRFASTRP